MSKDSMPVIHRGVTTPEWALSAIVSIWLVYGLVVILASIVNPGVMIVIAVAYTSVAALMLAITIIVIRGRRKAYQGHSVENALLTESGRAYLTRVRIVLILAVILAVTDFLMLIFLPNMLVNH